MYYHFSAKLSLGLLLETSCAKISSHSLFQGTKSIIIMVMAIIIELQFLNDSVLI